ncbi:MAG TPA: NBR1-Ig-like domain-containing protein [Anaerolineales bacterium]|nr:NBR1-Ig-like domain-containing protein [Anaerolineales bacterium]
MFNSYFKKLLIPVLAMILILACGPFAAATPQPAATLAALYTSAAETLNAMSTQGSYTATVQPLGTPTLAIGSPSSTPLVLQTATTVPQLPPVTRCDAADFIDDITYPDGSVVALGGSFTKIWRVKNIGTCTWNTSYAVVFVSGERFDAANSVALPGTVRPGESVDIPVNLTAPTRGGSYVGYWKLRNPSGALFGVGASDASMYVDVRVTGYTVSAYDFLAKACEASWTNGSGDDLPCPGTQGDDNGFVVVLNSPKLEDGKSIGNALLTYPEKGNNGLITGQYPKFRVETGDRFQAYIGCLQNANDCDMIYRLQYQIGNGDIKTLGQWREVYEGESYPVNLDLSFLAGQNVKFIFTVYANGSSHEDFALWITPRITRQSSQPPTSTPTATPTATPTKSYP